MMMDGQESKDPTEMPTLELVGETMTLPRFCPGFVGLASTVVKSLDR